MPWDYASMGFYTYDCLGWPVSTIPPGGGTILIDDLTIAVSGAAGTAAIAAAKLGVTTSAIGGVGQDMMGDWVLERVAGFGIDTVDLVRCSNAPTSSSIVLTREDGSRPALHMKGATGAFTVPRHRFDAVTDAKIFHLGGVGLMDAMDGAPNAELMAHAKARGCITTVDVFAGSPDDLPDVAAVLPYTDYFIPSVEEAEALTGLTDLGDMARFFIERGAACCIFTLGAEGAYYHHRDGTVFTVPAFEITPKCTCGCGDVFNAGFAVGLLRDMAPRDAVRFAQACSALNATGLGSQAGITDFDAAIAFMNDCPVRSTHRLAAAE
ncbi:sugar/nucleoside kinase (ribokinase family) [Limimaricola variabilis]|uniref:Sugar/nucleoside kinase (Ribokinase family) n=1 Tax=Limimaricola variabilis TaxID=1492771 RepID=A0ABR6HIV7_9RHOB|nr:carbohydrate kinase family protein [Limimaricola variabilis]MBB3710492.1 sugar/nucleoside kinase (ribokinase family) [Limimaricola variabilis]